MKLRIEVRNVEKPAGGAAKALEFTEGPVQVGRSSAGHVVLDEQPISRLQLVFEEIHGGWHATHRGTAVASVLNRTPMSADRPMRVAEGDTIRIGPFELRVGIVQMTELPELRPLSDVHGASMITMRPEMSPTVVGAFVPLPDEDVRGARPGPAGRGVPALYDPSAAPGSPRLEFTEVGRSYTIGRASTCDLPVANSSVSRQHALARFDGTTVYVKDAGSRNPVRVNGRPILGETPIAPGDTVSVGPVDLMFAVDQGDAPAFDAPQQDPLMTIDMDARAPARPAPAPPRHRAAPERAAPEWSPAPVAPAAPPPSAGAGGWQPADSDAPAAWSPPAPVAPAAPAPAPAPAPQPFFDAPPARPSAPPAAAPSWDMPAAPPPPPPQSQWEAPSQGPVWTPPPVDPGPRGMEPAPAAASAPPAPAQPPSPSPGLSPSAELRTAPRRGASRSGWLLAGIICMSCAVVGGIVLMLVSL